MNKLRDDLPALPPMEKREVIRQLAEARPDLWMKCYPRIYEIQGPYATVKDIAADMVGSAMKVELGYLGANEKIEILWASKLSKYRVPIYWLTPDMAQAIKQTTPPQTVNLQTFHLPFEAACFMLPKGALMHEEGEGWVSYLSYVRTYQGEVVPSLAAGRPAEWHQVGNGVLAVFAHTQQEHLMHWTIPDFIPVNLGALDELMQRYEGTWHDHDSEFKTPDYDNSMTPADNRLMARACHMVFGTLLLMLSRPDLLTRGELRKRVQKHHEQVAREFWTPNIIGKNYKLRRESIPQGGTHASPRGHWVRGFYRQQPVGPRLEHQHKEIWIEPFWRGGEQAEEIRSKNGGPQ